MRARKFLPGRTYNEPTHAQNALIVAAFWSWWPWLFFCAPKLRPRPRLLPESDGIIYIDLRHPHGLAQRAQAAAALGRIQEFIDAIALTRARPRPGGHRPAPRCPTPADPTGRSLIRWSSWQNYRQRMNAWLDAHALARNLRRQTSIAFPLRAAPSAWPDRLRHIAAPTSLPGKNPLYPRPPSFRRVAALRSTLLQNHYTTCLVSLAWAWGKSACLSARAAPFTSSAWRCPRARFDDHRQLRWTGSCTCRRRNCSL